MHELMLMRLANPSSQHADGRKARRVVEQARESILQCCGGRTVGMQSDQLLFTSGGTEANNLAIFGLSDVHPGAIVVSAIEHPSVLESVTQAASQGRLVHFLPVDSNGVTCLKSLQSLLDQHHLGSPISLVSIMLANNETGVLQPVREAAQMCRRFGVLIHTDAVQVLGKVKLDFASLDVDAMTVTAHKIHGPVGIGGLILRYGNQLAPRSFGGFQQLGLRPGTEMPVLAGGFEEAVLRATADVDSRTQTMQAMRDRLQHEIQRSIEGCVVVGELSQRLPHTLSIAFPGIERQALQLALDLAGIACSTGSACASGSSQSSHVLEAMHLPPEVVKGGIRFGVSIETTEAEVIDTAEQLARLIPKLRQCRPTQPAPIH